MDSEVCQTVIVQLPNESIFYDWFKEVHYFYKPIHTYLSIIMCVLGTIANFCNIVVLTRRQMRTPVNMILTAMACCDTVVLFSNLIYTTHYSFVAFTHCHPRHWSYGWALFLIAHAHLSLVGHSSSVWLSVSLAFIRYMTLRSRGKMGSVQIGLKHSYIAIATVIVFVAVVNAPNFLTYKINEMRLNDTCELLDPSLFDAPAYLPGISDLALAQQCLVFRLAFWISGTVFKVIPCCLLSLFVYLLLGILKEVKENRQRLLRGSRNNVSSTGQGTPKHGKVASNGEKLHRQGSAKNRGERTDRTTHMLLAIVFVLLITELPQGIMAVLSGMLSEEFRRHVYNNLGDLLDLLSLCGACTSFIIYCSMSGQFRNEFRRVFLPDSFKCSKRHPSVRRPSEPFTKMSLFPPTSRNGCMTNSSACHSPDERSVAITVVGSNQQIRRSSLSASPLPDTPLYSDRLLTPSPVPQKPSLNGNTTMASSQETVDDSTAFLKGQAPFRENTFSNI